MKINKLFEKEYMRIISQQSGLQDIKTVIQNEKTTFIAGKCYFLQWGSDREEYQLDEESIAHDIQMATNGAITYDQFLDFAEDIQLSYSRDIYEFQELASSYIIEDDYFIGRLDQTLYGQKLTLKSKQTITIDDLYKQTFYNRPKPDDFRAILEQLYNWRVESWFNLKDYEISQQDFQESIDQIKRNYPKVTREIRELIQQQKLKNLE